MLHQISGQAEYRLALESNLAFAGAADVLHDEIEEFVTRVRPAIEPGPRSSGFGTCHGCRRESVTSLSTTAANRGVASLFCKATFNSFRLVPQSSGSVAARVQRITGCLADAHSQVRPLTRPSKYSRAGEFGSLTARMHSSQKMPSKCARGALSGSLMDTRRALVSARSLPQHSHSRGFGHVPLTLAFTI